MKQAGVTLILSASLIMQCALAQTSSPQAPSGKSDPTKQTRPDARYPNPSGQDSRPGVTTPKQASGSTPGQGTVEARGTQTKQQSKPAQDVAKRGNYKGNEGRKGDSGTACSTARATPNGGVDCGTGGSGATPGKIPK